jgi:hypothetical protein
MTWTPHGPGHGHGHRHGQDMDTDMEMDVDLVMDMDMDLDMDMDMDMDIEIDTVMGTDMETNIKDIDMVITILERLIFIAAIGLLQYWIKRLLDLHNFFQYQIKMSIIGCQISPT